MSDQTGRMTLGDYADAVDLHPFWIGLLQELPVERGSSVGPAYTGSPPGTWTRRRRADWLRMCELIADMLYTLDEPQPQLPRPVEPDRVLGEAKEPQPPDPEPAPAPEPEIEPDPEPAPPPTATELRRDRQPSQVLVTDLVVCKITGCANKASRRGRHAGRCQDHKHLKLPAGGGRPPLVPITHDELAALQDRVEGWLTDAERSCIKLKADGLSDRQIAERLDISKSTVTRCVTRAVATLKLPLDAPPPTPQAPSSKTTTPAPAAPAAPPSPAPRKQEPPATAPAAADDPHDVIYCPYCRNNRFRNHVDEHVAEVDKERARQDEERAKISHLSRSTGVGGAA